VSPIRLTFIIGPRRITLELYKVKFGFHFAKDALVRLSTFPMSFLAIRFMAAFVSLGQHPASARFCY
jgi:hypothetical protein